MFITLGIVIIVYAFAHYHLAQESELHFRVDQIDVVAPFVHEDLRSSIYILSRLC